MLKKAASVCLIGTGVLLVAGVGSSEPFREGEIVHPPRQEVPRVFDEEGLKDFELPLPGGMVAEHITPGYYYGIPERVIHRTYPMYHPDFEPEGYLDSLRALGPGVALDTDTLDTDEEWIRAGELVFDAPQLYVPLDRPMFTPEGLVAAGTPVASDGTFPFQRYVVMPDGEVRIGLVACGDCHTRVLEDGTVVKGGQGNYPVNRILAEVVKGFFGEPPPRPGSQEQFRAPWIDHPSQTMLDTLTAEALHRLFLAIPDGVHTRQGTSPTYPASIPDLRGVRDIRFFDATGIMQQRSIGDLMRYAAFNQFVDHLNRYGDWVPSLGRHSGPLPPPDSVRSIINGRFTRFSDAQAFALARYLYSLEPLPSPYEYDAETLELGARMFVETGCVTCHPPPLYTNNELTPAPGFEPPEDHYERFPIFDVSVDTDPGLTLYTRRGTGYYKVPSLRGLWYRERLLHDGSVNLEELLDPARLRDDFVPSGFHGTDSTRAVPGHPFGFELDSREKAALLAYLRTL